MDLLYYRIKFIPIEYKNNKKEVWKIKSRPLAWRNVWAYGKCSSTQSICVYVLFGLIDHIINSFLKWITNTIEWYEEHKMVLLIGGVCINFNQIDGASWRSMTDRASTGKHSFFFVRCSHAFIHHYFLCSAIVFFFLFLFLTIIAFNIQINS